MFTQLARYSFAALAAIGLFVSAPQQAKAVTLDFTGGFSGTILPKDTKNQTDYFSAAVTGTLNFDPINELAFLTFNYNGVITDTPGGAQIGTVTGTTYYLYQNTQEKQLNGSDYILSLTGEGPGNGTGSFVDVKIGGLSDQAVFDLTAMALQPQGNEGWYAQYQPVSGFLNNNDLGAYLIVGDLAGFANSLHTWFGSSYFDLALGAGRTGQFKIGGDLHATFTGNTEVPEPSSLALLAVGAAGLARRRRKVQA